MNQSKFPKGWDEERVKNLISELDSRTDEEWIAEDEAAMSDGEGYTIVSVPTSLLPEVRRLIANHKS